MKDMKEINLVRQEMKEDSFHNQTQISPTTGRKRKKMSKSSSKLENERRLNEVLDKRRN